MSTAIELYRRAYDLDYRRGDWQQAEELYKQIVEKFPYCDEKEYALVHLERIEKLRGNPHDENLQPVRSGGGPLSVVNFALILIVAVGLTLNGWIWHQSRQKLHYQDLLLEGIVSQRIDNHANAAELFKSAQKLLPHEPLAYRFLAELYLINRQYPLADIEARKWQVADPRAKAIEDFEVRLRRAQQTAAVEP